MLQEDKQILWRASATLMGMALPSLLLGKGVMYGLLLAGMLAGMFATKDESLRVTCKMLLNSRVTLVVVVLLGCLLGGVVLGIDPAFAFERWTEVAVEAVGTALLFVVLREMPGRHVETLLKILSVSTLAVAALALLDALLGDVRLSSALHGAANALMPYRLNFVSAMLAVLLPFVWARLLVKAREGEPFALRVGLLATLFGIVAIVVCGGVSGWLGLVVAAAVFLGVGGRYHGLVVHARGWLVGIAAAVLGLLLYVFATGWEFVAQRLAFGDAMDSRLLAAWRLAWEHVFDKPLLGVGIMNFRHLPGSGDWHLHNWPLQMLLEGGVVGLAVFGILLYFILKTFSDLAKGSVYGVAGLAAVCAFLVAGLGNASIFNLAWLTFFSFISVLGWRVGWGSAGLKKRRRQGVVVKPVGR